MRRLVSGAVLFLLMVYPAWVTMQQVRAQITTDHSYYEAFRGSLPSGSDSSIVFVRYSREHNDGLSLVRNVPDLGDAPVWVVYDRGAENAKLISVAPGRSPYLFDEARWAMHPLQRDGTTILKDSVVVRKDSGVVQEDSTAQ